MNNHTKGPWTYRAEDNIITADGVHRLIDIIPRSQEVGMEERIANGYLVASAPELLEACMKFVDVWKYGSTSELAALLGEAYKQAKEAIAKATIN
jgi:hypothetical protein